eukprot:TRINITY_DN20923_c0_g1_i1.p1 TRINITY_DN20923_c0_g1~~TRINITY_DN20923_c0_g1_i1.p1  ORF type:complete len:303 (-),score=34.10 TRINITY_DN20923_c0_g1_i1:268-1176(-)
MKGHTHTATHGMGYIVIGLVILLLCLLLAVSLLLRSPSLDDNADVLPAFEHRRAVYTGDDPDLKKIYSAMPIAKLDHCPDIDLSCVEVISWEPRAFLYHGFLSDEMADHMMAIGYSQGIVPSKVASGEGDIPSDSRTSSGIFVHPDPSGVFECVEKRIAQWSQLNPKHGELFYLLEYQIGQQYRPHWDYFDPKLPGMKEYVKKSMGGQRLATALVYLYTPEEGGETLFPKVGKEVEARRGDALLFWDQTPNFDLDPYSMHGGNPVKKGVKVCATKWMTESEGGHIRSFWPEEKRSENLAPIQ